MSAGDTTVERLRWELSMKVDAAEGRPPHYPWIAREVVEFEEAVRAEEHVRLATEEADRRRSLVSES